MSANADFELLHDPEARRDVAHLGMVEIYTPLLDESVSFFVDQLGLRVVGLEQSSASLHAWDDYQSVTVRLIARAEAGVGRTFLRAASPAALERLVCRVAESGRRGFFRSSYAGLGPVYCFDDSDGHAMGLYWEVERYRPDSVDAPALKNQAAAFPGRGANVRRIDHVNYLTADVAATDMFLADVLGARCTERIITDDGSPTAVWYHFGNKTYDLVYTADWSGASGRLHHVAFATDTREDILRAADVFLEAGTFIETGPHKHAIQQTFFLYVYEPGGNRIELCNSGARLILAPDQRTVDWTAAERAKGQAWGLKTIDTFHTHGTPIIPIDQVSGDPR